uniref:RNA-directed DNA polymerase, eukaryota, reverse transcriptase zinc-binding domain protein n=1 Tax=Tanacetum cinerariifolium TaxID=118510 RepID=A0A6L2NDE5_TANCI|nr:RNA-directed DNA polymerase, eukaryota, reverse transcriptase zinc-binding domain protein [Tanacetum cinerariifolium]
MMHKELNVNNLFYNKINHDEAELMIRYVTDKEIKEAMFDIGENKAPGSDGFTSTFFKSFWDIVDKDVCLAIHDFFNSEKLLGEVNAIVISLILKLNSQTRIKGTLDKNVDFNQSAFIPGRIIQDSLVLSQELLTGYNYKNGPSRCALKIVIAKAYHAVNWCFLEKILNNFRFHKRMVKWIMTYVSSTAFTIRVNGERHGYFRSGRAEEMYQCGMIIGVHDDCSVSEMTENDFVKWENKDEKVIGFNVKECMDIVGKLADLPCNNNIRSVLRKILVATAVYRIWKERNARIFTNEKTNADNVLQKIIECIRLQLQSLKERKSAQICKSSQGMECYYERT